LRKTSGPALSAEQIGPIDAVLLSHDQHADNLDHSGRGFLAKARRVLTTVAGAKRLGENAEGLAPWATRDLVKPDRIPLRITATPARHGPAGIEPLAGDVIGFVLTLDGQFRPIYIPAIRSGMTALPKSRAGSSPASHHLHRLRRDVGTDNKRRPIQDY